MNANKVRREAQSRRSAPRRTVPYVLLRCEIRCDRDETERETEQDKLEKYSRPADGMPHGWEKSQERDGFLPLLDSLCRCLCRNTTRAHSSLDTFCV